MNLDDLITITQFATNTGYTRERIRQLIKAERIKALKIGNMSYIHKDAKVLPTKAKIGRPSKKS